MKIFQYIIIIYFLLFSINLFSQSPETPQIKYITVNQTNNTVDIEWTIGSTKQITGYIVKRKIWGGTGVVDGTYNNIEIINDSLIFSYTDNSAAYNTFTNPNIRSEYYRISSFLMQNDNIFYSNMSPPHRTIFVQSEYEVCKKQNLISWNTYLGWNVNNYEIYTKNSENNNYSLLATLSANDSSYIHKNLEPNITYYYYVEAESFEQNNEILYSKSNQTEIYTESPLLPEILNANFASVNENNEINIEFTTENDADVVKYKLLRANSPNGYFDTIAVFENNLQQISFTDTADILTVHYYKLIAINTCNIIFAESNLAQNIVLTTEINNTNTTRSNFLTWNKNNYWLGGVEKYDIYRAYENSDFELIGTVFPNDTIFTDNIQEFVYQNTANNGKFCYYVEAIEGDTNIYNIKSSCTSNINCIIQEPICYIPNAINPKSNIEENRIFKPKIIFCTDYYMAIYSRTGGKIFETKSLDKGWDGRTLSGKILMPDSYVYFISFKDNNNKKIEKTGFVNLMY